MTLRKSEIQQTIGKKHLFTQGEKKDMADSLTELIKKIEDLETDKKAVADSFKKKIDGLEVEKMETAKAYRTGFEIQDVFCDLYLDMATNERVWLEHETGLVVRRDPMLPSDKQLKLEMDVQL